MSFNAKKFLEKFHFKFLLSLLELIISVKVEWILIDISDIVGLTPIEVKLCM